MTLAEVEEILGGPARDEPRGPLTLDLVEGPGATDAEEAAVERFLELQAAAGRVGSSQRWLSDRLLVWVVFDTGGRVQSCDLFPVRRVPESPLALLRRWFGL
jgi:hypothetical protein